MSRSSDFTDNISFLLTALKSKRWVYMGDTGTALHMSVDVGDTALKSKRWLYMGDTGTALHMSVDVGDSVENVRSRGTQR